LLIQKPIAKKLISLTIIIPLAVISFFLFQKNTKGIELPLELREPVIDLYDSLKLEAGGLSRAAFDYGIKGYQYLLSGGKIKNDSVISIIDFSLSSGNKRLFVIDLKRVRILFNTYVSHGKKSGMESANEFSNTPNSNKSSLGFYITANTYQGKHGYSLRLEGEEDGINDNALSRGIVMHAASYVNEVTAMQRGYIGRSQGCPAIPEALHRAIIEKIKNGSCLFIYSPDLFYITHSVIIKDLADNV
jgi:L,D-transpeptidase catalytic domain